MRKSVLFLFFFSSFFFSFLLITSQVTAAGACDIGNQVCYGDGDCTKHNKNTCGEYYCLTGGEAGGRCLERPYNSSVPLTTPKIKTAASSSNSVTIQVERVVGAERYQVYDDAGTGQEIKTVNSTTEPYVNITVPTTQTGTTYAFTVAACRKDQCSEQSNRVTETTTETAGKKNLGQVCAPKLTGESQCSVGTCITTDGRLGICMLFSGNSSADLKGFTPQLELVSKTGNTASFTIKNASADVDTYAVFYQKQGETAYQTTTTKTNNFSISGLANNSTYTVHVFAANKSGQSPNSNPVTVTTSETAEKVATSCSNWDCNGKWCSRLNVTSGGPYCNITSQKGEPLSCSCGEPPPPPSPPCKPSDMDENGICKKLWTSLGIQLDTTPAGLAKTLFGIVLSISGGIALLLLMTSGYQILTSSGDPEKIQGAKDTITSTIIGLVFIIFSLVILQIIGVDVLRIPGLSK